MWSSIIESPRTRSAKHSLRPAISSGTVIESGVEIASIGRPAATVPSSGISRAPCGSGGTSSMERLRFHVFRSSPFSTRFCTCLCTVATEDRRKCAPISSRLGA
jgi:hypothetical protein